MVDIKTFLSIPGIRFTSMETNEKKVTFSAKATCRSSKCPICGKSSQSVHSSYVRNLKDLPVSEYSISIQLQVRKFFCKKKKCKQKIFSEQPSSDILKHSRMTSRSKDRILNILKETSARKGSLISKAILTPVSPSTALRFVHALPLPENCSNIIHLGIDDWAYRKGISYGTILINMDNGKVIDILPERNGVFLKAWLKKHPNIKIVCRDRASAFAKAVSEVLPEAEQVADRFHLVKNLSDAVYETIRDEHATIISCIRPLAKPKTRGKKTSDFTPSTIEKDPKNLYREEVFLKVKEMHRDGVSMNGISKTMGLNFRTVHKYINQTKLPKIGSKASIDYHPYLEVIRSGVSNGTPLTKIHNDITKLGFKGSFRTFWSHFHECSKDLKGEKNLAKDETEIIKSRFTVLSASRMAIYLSYNDIEAIPVEAHKKQIKQLIEKCELIKTLRDLIVAFKTILKSKEIQHFNDWLDTAYKTGKRKIKTLVNGIKMDIQSVHNAIMMDYNSGMVEGNVNRLKNIKRQMYGRASFELLKRKVILSSTG